MSQSLAAAGTAAVPMAEVVLAGDLARPAITRCCPGRRSARTSAHAPVLLAAGVDETPLDRAGPHLVLPQDRCGARCISGITAIRVDGGYPAPT
ncbi:hypothetical protein GCM10022233_07150 [Streptomyces shaanxiensis]|uniref:Uncharacterized protein n=1 Tax=Streptomyces shaanxiensis TaxID=653357 RepID=A0ABP7UDF5_9ACTN